MIETTRELCKMCGKQYEDSHIVPRAEFAPFWCDGCKEEANTACDGSWIAAVYQAGKIHDTGETVEEK